MMQLQDARTHEDGGWWRGTHGAQHADGLQRTRHALFGFELGLKLPDVLGELHDADHVALGLRFEFWVGCIEDAGKQPPGPSHHHAVVRAQYAHKTTLDTAPRSVS